MKSDSDSRSTISLPVRGQASTLNPHAGDHPVTANPRELTAVRRAADRAWTRFPYYQIRFGDRGYQFALSDGGWIVTLCDRDPREANHEVRWLGAVLSSRGMPQMLLQDYLQCLYEELVEAVPERKKHYGFLKRAAARMSSAADKVLSPSDFARLAAVLDGLNRELPTVGNIIVGAVVDEALGIENAVSSVLKWLTDETRFERDWIFLVNELVHRARAAVRKV